MEHLPPETQKTLILFSAIDKYSVQVDNSCQEHAEFYAMLSSWLAICQRYVCKRRAQKEAVMNGKLISSGITWI